MSPMQQEQRGMLINVLYSPSVHALLGFRNGDRMYRHYVELYVINRACKFRSTTVHPYGLCIRSG